MSTAAPRVGALSRVLSTLGGFVGIKAILNSQAELDAQPEAIRGLYENINGKFVLPIEGVVPASELDTTKTKLAEFRDNNIGLLKKSSDLEALVKKFEGVDADEYKALKAEADKLRSKGVKGADDLSAIIQKAIVDATKPLSDKLTLIEEDRAKLKREVEENTLSTSISEVGGKKGVKAKALPYVLGKAKDLFRVVDGKIAAREGVFSSLRPTEGLTPDEWFDALAKTDDFLFEASTGGGANGSGAGGIRPGAKTLVNPTPAQMGEHMDAIAKGDMVVVRQ